MSGENLGKAYAAIFFIVKKPRSVDELSDVQGCTQDTARRYIKAAVDQGLVSVVEKRKNKHGPDTSIYGMTQL